MWVWLWRRESLARRCTKQATGINIHALGWLRAVPVQIWRTPTIHHCINWSGNMVFNPTFTKNVNPNRLTDLIKKGLRFLKHSPLAYYPNNCEVEKC